MASPKTYLSTSVLFSRFDVPFLPQRVMYLSLPFSLPWFFSCTYIQILRGPNIELSAPPLPNPHLQAVYSAWEPPELSELDPLHHLAPQRPLGGSTGVAGAVCFSQWGDTVSFESVLFTYLGCRDASSFFFLSKALYSVDSKQSTMRGFCLSPLPCPPPACDWEQNGSNEPKKRGCSCLL